ncbi:MAG: transcriptional regulator AraC family [Puniceicoccaceae bacterium 5H]|nr:MAG: transcriptional regulator AraC family [Puniceicoccaceae bacterium 5H]
MHAIGFLIYEGFQLLDLAGPVCAFQNALDAEGEPVYRVRVLSATGGSVLSNAGIAVDSERVTRCRLDTLIVVGGQVERMLEPAQVQALERLQPGVRRLASVCTGAFLLAQAHQLSGRCVTTHWKYAQHLQRDYPDVRVEPDRIFVRDGAVWTSAGITAGIDLALALIEADLGAAAAQAVAKHLVVYYRRPGGQSQFSELSRLETDSDRMRRVLGFARAHLPEDLSVERLAEVACLSPRQFSRAFKQATGESPAKAVERLRVEAARSRLEGDDAPVEAIAAAVGFGDPERMRRAFLRWYGQPPQAVRRAARS